MDSLCQLNSLKGSVMNNKKLPMDNPLEVSIKLKFTFACRFRLLLAFDARLFIMLPFANLLLDTGFRTVSFESAECAI